VSRILLYQSPNSRLLQLESALTRKGHQVLTMPRSAEPDLDDTSAYEPVDVIIVDVSCGLDGNEYCRAFNQVWPNTPLVVLLAEGVSIDRECRTLTAGNVLRLPFTPRKVINRVRKLLSCRSGGLLRVGAISLNVETRCVFWEDVTHRLTPRQAKLLEVFMRHAGQTLTRKFLMENVWETDYMGDTRTLDVHVRWIRERIERNPSSPRYLRTVRGIGYRFGVPGEDEGTNEGRDQDREGQ
jgi:DNA-binding response OmpR family regulator